MTIQSGSNFDLLEDVNLPPSRNWCSRLILQTPFVFLFSSSLDFPSLRPDSSFTFSSSVPSGNLTIPSSLNASWDFDPLPIGNGSTLRLGVGETLVRELL